MHDSLSLTIRQVDLSHADTAVLIAEVQEYYRQIYGGPDDAPVDIDEFKPPHGAFFVGYELGMPVAMGGWRFHLGPLGFPTARPAEIKRMYVVKSARGRGYARAVLAQLEATAQAAGADAMVLETGSVQPEAIALYVSSGYRRVPKFGYYAAAEKAVHLGKQL